MTKVQYRTRIIIAYVIHFWRIELKLDAVDLARNYIGCYRYIDPSIYIGPIESIDECLTKCYGEKNDMVALARGKECSCVNKMDAATSSYLCNAHCSSKESCGGDDFYSVYRNRKNTTEMQGDSFCSKQEPSRLGNSNRISDLSSVEECAFFCLEKNQTFFNFYILQCYCFSDYKPFPPIRTVLKCDECLQDSNDTNCCDISLKDCIITYTSRFIYDFQRGLSTYSHCGHEESKIQKCPKGCDPGWTGDSCRERSCLINNGDCGDKMKCVELSVNGQQYVECECLHGLVRNKWNLCEVFRINLALHQSVHGSSTNDQSSTKYLNDGMCDGYNFAQADAWLAVELQKLYCVGFVRVYGKICLTEKHCNHMNEFVIRLNRTINLISKTQSSIMANFCGRGPKKPLQAGNPMIVICQNFTVLSKFVIIHQSEKLLTKSQIAVAELEVFEVGCDIMNGRCSNQKCTEVRMKDAKIIKCVNWTDTKNVTEPFYGCYEIAKAEYEHPQSGLSYKDCKNACKTSSYKLSVVKAGYKCSCGNYVVVSEEAGVEKCRDKLEQYSLVYHECKYVDDFCESTIEFTVSPDDLLTPIGPTASIGNSTNYTSKKKKGSSNTTAAMDGNGAIKSKYYLYVIILEASIAFLVIFGIVVIVVRKKWERNHRRREEMAEVESEKKSKNKSRASIVPSTAKSLHSSDTSLSAEDD
ncbi:hypothetical protein HELRODRAFT_178337 [Helobdella robusta]|uniref:WSC domain-containing protein n=1 Tax=Helobdella robusta TaxID=6412 RepID=T1FD32_HELRO|nr:hypothetical protein HELRODRAFT_178337 [Helobdella robusta]ESN97215.1 hypothetical protein HELRODRAFT_178337 [Helobdella robusta]